MDPCRGLGLCRAAQLWDLPVPCLQHIFPRFLRSKGLPKPDSTVFSVRCLFFEWMLNGEGRGGWISINILPQLIIIDALDVVLLGALASKKTCSVESKHDYSHKK